MSAVPRLRNSDLDWGWRKKKKVAISIALCPIGRKEIGKTDYRT